MISTFPFILKATQNPSYTAAGQMDDVSALTDYVAEAKKYADSAKETTAILAHWHKKQQRKHKRQKVQRLLQRRVLI